MSSSGTITANDLYNLTKCAHRVYLDANGDPKEKSEVSPFVKLLDLAERVLPSITPEMLVDASPSMRRF